MRARPLPWFTRFTMRPLRMASFSVTTPEQPMDDNPEPVVEFPLAKKVMIVVATKIDSANPEKLKKLAAHVKRKKLEFHAISAVTGEGIEELKWSLAKQLRPVEE